MSELAIHLDRTPPAPISDKPKRLEVRRKLKQALDAMIWGVEQDKPLQWADAATAVGFNVAAMRKALERPHVQAYLRAQRQVLRASICAGNPSRLRQLRDQDANLNAAVSAVKLLEQLDDPEHSRASVAPFGGITVQIVTVAHTQSAPNEVQVIDNTTDGAADDSQ